MRHLTALALFAGPIALAAPGPDYTITDVDFLFLESPTDGGLATRTLTVTVTNVGAVDAAWDNYTYLDIFQDEDDFNDGGLYGDQWEPIWGLDAGGSVEILFDVSNNHPWWLRVDQDLEIPSDPNRENNEGYFDPADVIPDDGTCDWIVIRIPGCYDPTNVFACLDFACV